MHPAPCGFNFPDPSHERRVRALLNAGLILCFGSATLLALAAPFF